MHTHRPGITRERDADAQTEREGEITREELEEYEILEYTFLTYERKMILNQTGCRVPCKYKVMILSSASVSLYLLSFPAIQTSGGAHGWTNASNT